MKIKKTLKTSDVAKYCQVSRRTVLNWISENKIRVHRTPGRHVRIKVSDFILFLKTHLMPIPNELRSAADEKVRVLIVDDDKALANVLVKGIEMDGHYQAQSANDGFEAGVKISSYKPQVVILDVCMPLMDGYEVVAKIRRPGQNIKIIAMSGYFDQEGREKILKLGADICVEKPVTFNELLVHIEELLHRENN